YLECPRQSFTSPLARRPGVEPDVRVGPPKPVVIRAIRQVQGLLVRQIPEPNPSVVVRLRNPGQDAPVNQRLVRVGVRDADDSQVSVADLQISVRQDADSGQALRRMPLVV